jgi:transcription elongation factor GreA
MSEAHVTPTTQQPDEPLFAMIEAGDLDAAEGRWIEILESPPLDLVFYEKFLRAMRRAHALDRAHELLLLALDELEARGQWPHKLAVVRLAARFWPDSKPLRPHAARALKQVYAEIPQLSDMIAACKGLPLDRVFDRFDELRRMLPGQVYTHPYWGTGIVRELDIPGDRVVLEFPESDPARRELKLEFLQKHLHHCPPESFTARLLTEPSALREMALADPVAFIKLVLADYEGHLKPSELKDILLDRLFPESEWTRWWGQARTQLKLDPWIDFDASRGSRAEITLRAQPRTFEDELLESYFDPAASLAQRTQAVKQLVKMLESGAHVDAAVVQKVQADLAARARSTEAPIAERLTAVYLHELLGANSPQAAAAQGASLPTEDDLLSQVTDYAALADMPEPAHLQRCLKRLVARDGMEGIEQAAALLPSAAPTFAQALWNVIDAEKHTVLAVRALRALFERPLDNPETFHWAARQLTERKWTFLDDFLPLGPFVLHLLELLNELDTLMQRMGTSPEQAEKAKWLLGRVRSLITADEFEVLVHVVRDMTRDQVQELRRAIQWHNVFNEAARAAADRAIRLVRRDLEEPAATTAPQATAISNESSGPLLCTEKGRARAAAELHELNTVTIPENAKEIEKARSEGDLRENAGYHGARERHAHLLRRAHYLQEGLGRAQVVRSSDVNTEAISFGTRVALLNLDSGKEETYTLLGPWESDPARGIYDCKAPLFAQMMGKKVGEEFTARTVEGAERRYRVLSIENALASGEWDEPHDH